MRLSDHSQQNLEDFLRGFLDLPEFSLPFISIHTGPVVDLFTRVFAIDGITVGRYVFVNSANVEQTESGDISVPCRLLIHEATHVAQYKQLGIPKFLTAYTWEFLRGLFAQLRAGRTSMRTAYYEIDKERQARLAEDAFNMWETRSF